jgi:hypothetical protein
MHCEHKQQRNELALWQEYLGHWQGELEAAIGDLDRLRKSLQCHETALKEHGAALGRQREQIDKHEHALAEWERGGTEPGLISQAKEHQNETKHHRELREIHERIKKHHHTLLGNWRLLCDATTRPM